MAQRHKEDDERPTSELTYKHERRASSQWSDHHPIPSWKSTTDEVPEVHTYFFKKINVREYIRIKDIFTLHNPQIILFHRYIKHNDYGPTIFLWGLDISVCTYFPPFLSRRVSCLKKRKDIEENILAPSSTSKWLV